MSPLALVLIVIGLLIAASRAPLIVAPEGTRSLYLKLMETDGRMRGLAVFIMLLGAVMIWASAPETTAVAAIVYWLGLLMLAIATFFILLPGQARRLATTTWGSFSTGVLRGLGLVALVFGLLVAAYGLNL
ncbi:MAG: hypothetical protein P1U69_07470 [Parvibaculaceae bacterium]|nr:hypothetical protein [Parvibaculaceae bacterium]HBM87868.1 hypothetical protein [Rhodobiaceae bacterium]